MDPVEDAVPRAIALAWGVAANPQRGPKRELNIELIVDTAIAIADEKGISAVSMSSVSSALGFTTMSLYRYLSAKDDLLLLMQEVAVGLPPLSIGEAETWRDGLERWYRASLDIYFDHPWLLDIAASTTPGTPNNLAWLDSGLGVLRDTPLDLRSRVAAVVLLTGQARWESMNARGHGNRAAADDSLELDASVLASLVTAEQFPDLYPAIQAGAFASHGEANEFGAMRILDGLTQFIAETSASTPPSQPKASTAGREFATDEGVQKARQRIKDAEGKLRDARQKEREAVARARERAAKRS